MSWNVRKIGDIVDKIIGGGTPSKSKSEYWDGDIYWASVKDMSEGKYSLSETQDTITREGLDNSSASLINEGTLIVSTRMGLGRAFINTVPMAINQDLKAIYPNKKFVDNDFLLWNYVSQAAHIESMGNGATVKGIRLEQLKSIEIKLPPLQTQKRIADILCAYDDLIENNLKRIKLLEQAAQNIYKEWFVNLRFPGYENTPINEETGLPVGWMKLTVEEYTKVASRGPSLNYKVDEGFPVLNQSCIRNAEIELDKVRIAAKLKENKEHCYLQINDILINSMGQGTLGRVSKNNSITEKFIIHNCITFLRSKDEYSQTLLYHFISSKENYFISISQGSTGQTTLKLSLIKEMEINTPSADLMKLFDNQVLPMWTQIGYLKNQNQKLKAARDILLPRLMNRTIEV